MAHLFQQAVKRRPRARASAGARHAETEFGRRLAEVAHNALAGARRALRGTGPEAVHDLRKAFKRWRALLRLLHAAVGTQAEEMRIEARSLMRRLSDARDAQGALDALGELAEGDATISPASRKAMHARMAALRDAVEAAAFTPELRAGIERHLDGAARAIARWEVEKIAFETIADALTATYRRARKLVPKTWRDAEPAELHALRRRVVELRHQMETVEPLRPKFRKLGGDEAQRLRAHLGAAQDLTLLTFFAAPHRPLAAWRSRLGPAVDARRAAHLRTAERVAGRLFAEKPKAFRRRIAALCEARAARKKSHG